MEYRKTSSGYLVRIDRGEEIVEQLTALCKQEEIICGGIYGLGAADHAVIGLYHVGEQKYYKKELNGAMEITSLVGNISRKDGEPYLHLHINLCNSEMQVFGGHMNECRIGATCELIVTPIDYPLGRKTDPEIGLNIFDFE